MIRHVDGSVGAHGDRRRAIEPFSIGTRAQFGATRDNWPELGGKKRSAGRVLDDVEIAAGPKAMLTIVLNPEQWTTGLCPGTTR